MSASVGVQSSSCRATHSTWSGVKLPESSRISISVFRYSCSNDTPGLRERADTEDELLALPAAHARELVELVELAPLRGDPAAVAEEPVLAVEAAVVREPHDHPRQDRAPALVVGARIARLQRDLVRRRERLHEVEHRVPQPRLDARALLVELRVLLRQLRDDRFDARVDAQQRLHLPRTGLLARAREAGHEFQRLLLHVRRLVGRQLADPARRVVRAGQRIGERPEPVQQRGGLHHCGVTRTSGVAHRQRPATVMRPTRIDPVWREPRRSTSLPTATMSRNMSRRLPGDRDLLDRIGDDAVLDPEAGDAAREVAGHGVHALAQLLGHEQAAAHPPQQRGQVVGAMREHEVVAAAAVAGRLHAELARRVRAQEIALHDAVAHDVARRGRDSFAVERRAAAPAQHVRLLAQLHVRREHLRAERIDEERRLAIEAAAGDRLHEEADQVGGLRAPRRSPGIRASTTGARRAGAPCARRPCARPRRRSRGPTARAPRCTSSRAACRRRPRRSPRNRCGGASCGSRRRSRSNSRRRTPIRCARPWRLRCS